MTDMTERVGTQVTFEELSALMKRTAGVHVEPPDLRARAEEGFDSFGLDSLGLLGIVAELEKKHGVGLPEQVERCKTPAEFLAQVNATLKTAV
ncbi:acyl carrier protein [Streptomyces sp. NPDC052701]|uniref:acyl carrier protein n=1 Tax=Streptomyces sp. NPDC052701 TaxID=3155533 RepID=UPI0034222BB6